MGGINRNDPGVWGGRSGAKTEGFPPLMRLPARNHHHYLKINFLPPPPPPAQDIRRGAIAAEHSHQHSGIKSMVAQN